MIVIDVSCMSYVVSILATIVLEQSVDILELRGLLCNFLINSAQRLTLGVTERRRVKSVSSDAKHAPDRVADDAVVGGSIAPPDFGGVDVCRGLVVGFGEHGHDRQ